MDCLGMFGIDLGHFEGFAIVERIFASVNKVTGVTYMTH